jgi:hypothetical protein
MGTEATPPATGPANRKARTLNGNGRTDLKNWLLGIIATLIIAGVIATISTHNAVGRIDENLGLLRSEVRREFDRHEVLIRDLDDELDAHRTTEAARTGGGGS